jgi:hypothetical protein
MVLVSEEKYAKQYYGIYVYAYHQMGCKKHMKGKEECMGEEQTDNSKMYKDN